jgi:glutathione S-transferase
MKVNPKGYVPALRLDDGSVLTESPAIVQYLTDQNPASGLAPKAGTIERYRLQEWLNFIGTETSQELRAAVQKGLVGRGEEYDEDQQPSNRHGPLKIERVSRSGVNYLESRSNSKALKGYFHR